MKDLSPDQIANKAIHLMATLPSSREIIFPVKLAPRPVDAIA